MVTTVVFLVLTLLLILLNAFFVLAEFAFVKARPTQIEALADKGHRSAHIVQRIQTHLDKYLNVCQIGITLASIGLGVVGEPVLAKLFTPVFENAGLGTTAFITSHGVATVIAYLLVSYLHIVLGEQVPKIMAIRQTEQAALYTAYPMLILYYVFYAPSWVLNGSVNLMLKIFRIPPVGEHSEHSDQEVRIILDQSQSSGMMSFRRLLFIENVLDMGELVVRNAMQARGRVQVLRTGSTVAENDAIIAKYRYSRYPLIRNNEDCPCGFIHVKDLLLARQAGRDTSDLTAFIKPCLKVKDNDPLEQVLAEMQRKGIRLASVFDNSNSWKGIVSLEDLLEEVVGTIEEEYPVEALTRLTSAFTSARLVIPDVKGDTIVAAVHDALSRIAPMDLPLSVNEIMPYIADRERTGSSYVGHSLAIPHARLKNISAPVVLFARLKRPIAAPTSSSKDTIRYLFILLTPSGAPRQHQILLSRIAGIFESGYLDARLEDAANAQQLYDAIVAVEQATDMPG